MDNSKSEKLLSSLKKIADNMEVKLLIIFSLFILAMTFGANANEGVLFVQLEALKNEIKVRGYSKESHQTLLELFKTHKDKLGEYKDQALKNEMVTLMRASQLVQSLKECVDTGHEDINAGIDSLFNSILSSGCVHKAMNDSTLKSLIEDTNQVLDVSSKSNRLDTKKVRQDLFEVSLPGLLTSFNQTRSLISDTDEKFMKSADELFGRLPSEKRKLDAVKTGAKTSTEVSSEILGPINELYEEAFGDQADLALSDRWKEVYTAKEGVSTPHLFSSEQMKVDSTKEALSQCLAKAQKIKKLQAKAKERFSQLRGHTAAKHLTGLIPMDERMERDHNELGFMGEPQCQALGKGLVGDHRMDRYPAAISANALNDENELESIAYANKSVVMTLGHLGEDPNNVYTTSRRETLDTRSMLGAYTEAAIKERQTKALSGMQEFINYMGRRVYGGQAESTGEQLLDGAGDIAHALTSLGESAEVDVALLLLSNPAAGMNYLVNTPGAADSFCDSFKALRNQNNVNQAIEIASILSMFTGVGGMVVKGGGLLAKGIRVSNFAMAGADTLSTLDTMTNARDIALANACSGQDEHLCETYMNSDRNFTLAVAGLALNGGAISLGAARKLTQTFRGALVLKNGENARGLISDYEKLSGLLSKASPSQQKGLARLLARTDISEVESARLVSLIQNNENVSTLRFLEDFSKLDKRGQDELVARILKKSADGGGVCTF